MSDEQELPPAAKAVAAGIGQALGRGLALMSEALGQMAETARGAAVNISHLAAPDQPDDQADDEDEHQQAAQGDGHGQAPARRHG